MIPIDLIFFLTTVVLIFVQGIPRVKNRVWLPLHLEFRELSDEQLTEKQKKYYGGLDEKLAKLHYYPVLTYIVPNLQGPNLSRCYLNSTEPSVITAARRIETPFK
jgi:hypothetical protein